MFDCSSWLAIFIDGAVLHATAKTLGFDVNYKRLGQEFANRGARVSPVPRSAPIVAYEFKTASQCLRYQEVAGQGWAFRVASTFVPRETQSH